MKIETVKTIFLNIEFNLYRSGIDNKFHNTTIKREKMLMLSI